MRVDYQLTLSGHSYVQSSGLPDYTVSLIRLPGPEFMPGSDLSKQDKYDKFYKTHYIGDIISQIKLCPRYEHGILHWETVDGKPLPQTLELSFNLVYNKKWYQKKQIYPRFITCVLELVENVSKIPCIAGNLSKQSCSNQSQK